MRAALLRIHTAAGHRNFQGTFVVTAGGVASSARIAHFCAGPDQFEHSETLDGEPRHVFRHNEEVTTLWPASKLAVVERREQIGQFPALLHGGDDRIAEHYDVRADGTERIAGRQADVLHLEPRDALRYGYRLWTDRATGLLLRADVLGAHQGVLESAAFSEVTIGVASRPDAIRRAMQQLDGYRIVRPHLIPTPLEAAGWSMRQGMPGFREVSSVSRAMPGEDPTLPGHPALQTIYSDGLTYVSLFIEPFDAERPPRPISAAVGPMHTLMKQRGVWWVTVVGDVPPATLERFADGLTRIAK